MFLGEASYRPRTGLVQVPFTGAWKKGGALAPFMRLGPFFYGPWALNGPWALFVNGPWALFDARLQQAVVVFQSQLQQALT